MLVGIFYMPFVSSSSILSFLCYRFCAEILVLKKKQKNYLGLNCKGLINLSIKIVSSRIVSLKVTMRNKSTRLFQTLGAKDRCLATSTFLNNRSLVGFQPNVTLRILFEHAYTAQFYRYATRLSGTLIPSR